MGTEFLIIGGGPAGCTAALFAAKAKRSVAMIHKGDTPILESLHWFLPGFPESVGPTGWLQEFRKEVDRRGVSIVPEEVTEATLGASEKKITTAGGKVLEAPVIILASGCYDRRGLIEGEERFVGHGVYYNAFQDGFWFEGKALAVEGKNEQAVREVLYLSRYASKIYFVVPAMKLDVEEKLLKAIQDHSKIEVMLSASIKKVEGEEKFQGVTVLAAGEEKKLEAEALFLYSRQSIPQYEFLKGTIEISNEGCVLVDDQMMTSIPGIFACGDMLAGVPQLPFVSAAQGMVAALCADRYLANLNL